MKKQIVIITALFLLFPLVSNALEDISANSVAFSEYINYSGEQVLENDMNYYYQLPGDGNLIKYDYKNNKKIGSIYNFRNTIGTEYKEISHFVRGNTVYFLLSNKNDSTQNYVEGFDYLQNKVVFSKPFHITITSKGNSPIMLVDDNQYFYFQTDSRTIVSYSDNGEQIDSLTDKSYSGRLELGNISKDNHYIYTNYGYAKVDNGVFKYKSDTCSGLKYNNSPKVTSAYRFSADGKYYADQYGIIYEIQENGEELKKIEVFNAYKGYTQGSNITSAFVENKAYLLGKDGKFLIYDLTGKEVTHIINFGTEQWGELQNVLISNNTLYLIYVDYTKTPSKYVYYKPISDISRVGSYTIQNHISTTHSKNDITNKYTSSKANYDANSLFEIEPSYTSPYNAGKLKKNVVDSVSAKVNYYRYLTGLHELEIDEEKMEMSQTCTLLMKVNNSFSHYQSYTDSIQDMNQEMFELGRNGCLSNNLSYNSSLYSSVAGYITDVNNVEPNVGHRGALLDIDATSMSMGSSFPYTAIGTYGNEGRNVNTESFYAYPAPGYMPIEEFSVNAKWSFVLNPKFNINYDKARLTLTVENQTYPATVYKDYYGVFYVLPDEIKNYLTEGANSIIDGKRVTITFTGLVDDDYNKVTISYTTEFFRINGSELSNVTIRKGKDINASTMTLLTTNSVHIDKRGDSIALFVSVDADAYDPRLEVEVENKSIISLERKDNKYGMQVYEIKALKNGTTKIFFKRTSDGSILRTIEISVGADISYTTHVQNLGWQSYVSNGNMAGTSGKGLRLEGIKIKVSNSPYTGGVEYRTHIQNIGWESDWKRDDSLSGTSGKGLRLEAIQIRLTNELANHYDVYYRVHAQNLGWLGWAKNGESAGTQGYAYRLEGIEIKLIEKGDEVPINAKSAFVQKVVPNISYTTHVQNLGWQSYVSNGTMAGTSGKGLRLEGIKIKVSNSPYAGGVEYRTHIQNIGWESDWKRDDTLSGTSGKGLRLEAIQIRLTGEIANHYDVYYRVHAQNLGWLGWAKNGESAGTQGYAYRLEGIEIKLIEKGKIDLTSNKEAFVKK